VSARAAVALRAVRDFLRGFLGLAGAPGAPTPRGGVAETRRALAERAARRPPCC